MSRALHTLAATFIALLMLLMVTPPTTSAAGEGMTVVSTSPAARILNAPINSPISVTFDRAIDPATITANSFWGFGKWSGTVQGTYSFSNGNQTVTLTPSTPLMPGESVTIFLSTAIEGADNTPLRVGGYSFQFWTSVAPSGREYTSIDVFTTRTTPGENTRSYGGGATDLNNDGWGDLIVINEDTADVRIFLNEADGTGLFTDMLTPTTPVNIQASPSEPADFDRDGDADMVVVNISTNSISVLLGNGDGSFGANTEIPVGSLPRGVAVLDAEGDGDTDIVVASTGGVGNLALLLNDGNGVFGAPTYFESGDNDEWGLYAADMNEDGLLDLIVGTQHASSPEILIMTNDGNGTFTMTDRKPSGGAVWMITTADMNGDGHEDVMSANSVDDNGAILLGNGDGTMGNPTTVPTDQFPLSTDVADVDGDGDLDWTLSAYFGSLSLYVNDGNGNFTLDQVFTPTDSSSCAVMFDFDNDGDIDIALIDETADEITLLRNNTVPTALSLSDMSSGGVPATAWMWWGVLGLVVTATVIALRSKR
jgi:hypothetical protein